MDHRDAREGDSDDGSVQPPVLTARRGFGSHHTGGGVLLLPSTLYSCKHIN